MRTIEGMEQPLIKSKLESQERKKNQGLRKAKLWTKRWQNTREKFQLTFAKA